MFKDHKTLSGPMRQQLQKLGFEITGESKYMNLENPDTDSVELHIPVEKTVRGAADPHKKIKEPLPFG
jgi:hypothetical protein